MKGQERPHKMCGVDTRATCCWLSGPDIVALRRLAAPTAGTSPMDAVKHTRIDGMPKVDQAGGPGRKMTD